MDAALSIHHASLDSSDLSLFSLASIRVLVVPVGRIPANVFQRFLSILQRYGLAIPQSEITAPPSAAGVPANRMHPHSEILFNFTTHYDRSHESWEEFQIHRQPLAIIGLMHCPSVERNLAADFQRYFPPYLNMYPTALVSRCFAFEPADHQPDDTKGLVLIPNQRHDQIAFYLHTLMADVASDLIASLTTLIAATERKTSVGSPANTVLTSGPDASRTINGGTFVQSRSGIPTVTSSSSRGAPPPEEPSDSSVETLASSRSDSVISLETGVDRNTVELAMKDAPTKLEGESSAQPALPSRPNSTAGISVTGGTSTLDHKLRQSKTVNSRFFQLGSAAPAKSSPSSTHSSSGPFAALRQELDRENPVAGAVNAGTLTGFSEILKEKRKLPGRIQKLIADMFLVSGYWAQALQAYISAAESAKTNSDFLWLAGALEGRICVIALMANAELRETGQHKEFIAVVKEIPNAFQDILGNYAKADAHLMTVNACLRASRWMVELWNAVFRAQEKHFFAKYRSEIKLDEGGDPSSPVAEGNKTSLLEATAGEKFALDPTQLVEKEQPLITKSDAAAWTMRVWESGVEKLLTQDQIRTASAMAANFASIGYHRKYAFYLRQTALLLLPSTLRTADEQKRAAETTDSYATDKSRAIAKMMEADLAVTSLLTASVGYGVISGIASGSAQINRSLMGYEHPEDLMKEPKKENNRGHYGATTFGRHMHRLGQGFGHGWLDLQVDILKEGVAISDRVQDFERCALFLSALITRLHVHISRNHKYRVLSALKRVSMKLAALAPTTFVPTLPPVVHQSDIPRFASFRPLHRFNMLKRITVSSHTDGKRMPPALHILKPVVEKQHDGGVGTSRTDPFIYNPYASKKDAQKKLHVMSTQDDSDDESALSTINRVIVQGELAKFVVVLDNPFDVDMELETVSLITSGVSLSDARVEKGKHERIILAARPEPSSSSPMLENLKSVQSKHISSKTEVLISGIPRESGKLMVHGCLVQFGNGWVEEWSIGRNGRIHRREQGRTEITPFAPLVATRGDLKHGMEVHVTPNQPLLKLKETSLLHSLDMTLFEGEQSSVEFSVENIGRASIEYLKVYCTETQKPLLAPDGEENSLENLYEKEFYNHSTKAFYCDPAVDYPALPLHQGNTGVVRVQVFGKKNCTGGSIDIEYGCKKMEDVRGDGSIYVRRLSISLGLTVHRVLIPIYMDILPFWFSESIDSRSSKATTKRQLSVEELLIDAPNKEDEKGDHQCLFVLDVRNSWTSPFKVSFLLRDPAAMVTSNDLDPRYIGTESTSHTIPSPPTSIQPLQTKRIAIPIPRLQLEEFLKEMVLAHKSQTPGMGPTSKFVFPSTPSDTVPDVPPIPVIKEKQFVVPKDGLAKTYAMIQSKVKKIRKERRAKRYAAMYPPGGASQQNTGHYWIAGNGNEETTTEKQVRNTCWWYRDSSDDEEEDQIRQDLTLAQTQIQEQIVREGGQMGSPVDPAAIIGVALRDFRLAKEQAIDDERWARVTFWYRDQLFRRCIAGIQWTCDETSYGHLARHTNTRSGTLDLRSEMRLARGMVMSLKTYNVEVDLDLQGQPHPRQKSRSHWIFSMDEQGGFPCATLTFRVRSTLSKLERRRFYILRVQPIQDTSESEGQVSYDMKGKLLWSGALQAIVASSGTEGTATTPTDSIMSAVFGVEHCIPFRFLSTGVFKFLWHLEEVAEPWSVGELQDRWMDRRTELQWCSEPLVVEVV